MHLDFSIVGSFLAVGALLGIIGSRINKMVFRGKPKTQAVGWRRLWYRTVWLHPIVAGALLALVAPSLPAPLFMGDGRIGAMVWFGLAGGESHLIVRMIDAAFKRADGRVLVGSAAGRAQEAEDGSEERF